MDHFHFIFRFFKKKFGLVSAVVVVVVSGFCVAKVIFWRQFRKRSHFKIVRNWDTLLLLKQTNKTKLFSFILTKVFSCSNLFVASPVVLVLGVIGIGKRLKRSKDVTICEIQQQQGGLRSPKRFSCRSERRKSLICSLRLPPSNPQTFPHSRYFPISPPPAD